MHPDGGPFCGVPRHFSLKYVSIPVEKCLVQHKNSSLSVTSCVFRYTLGFLLWPVVYIVLRHLNNRSILCIIQYISFNVNISGEIFTGKSTKIIDVAEVAQVAGLALAARVGKIARRYEFLY